ncbi:MAG: hypothetical protein EXX96DRAFT_575663 [Benjaminiella poitrasii]|nr:MAG: hypothetical protein EXX96DRAFT_575663 [Benjaminiella poitrasii]
MNVSIAMSRSFAFNFFLFALIFACRLTKAQEELQTSPTTNLTVYHQKDGEYIKRGTIAGLPGVPEYYPTENEIVSFKKNSFYQIKLKDESTGKVYLQTVKMCQMVASDWNDEFILHLDENGNFYHADYYALFNDCFDETIEYPVTTKPFTSTLRVIQPIVGPKPFIGQFVGGASQQKKTQQSSNLKVDINDEIPEHTEIAEKSFFQKYWYFILGGLFLLTTLAGPAPPEGSNNGPPARR